MISGNALRWTALVLGVACGAIAALAQESGREQKFSVSAHKYGFSPARIDVQQDDLVRITLTTQDIPHSFTVDDYRIVKRASAGQTVTFEFRADRSGPFTFYCNLSQDAKCKDMKGSLTVK